MKILDLVDGKVIISPEALGLSFLGKLWDRDKNKQKDQAKKEISYVFYYSDFSSPFFEHDLEKKKQMIAEYIMKDKAYKPDKAVLDAVKEYEKLTKTPSMELFESVTSVITKMKNYFDSIDLLEEDVDKIQKAIINMPKLQIAVQEALNNCKKEQAASNVKNRGGMTAALYEE